MHRFSAASLPSRPIAVVAGILAILLIVVGLSTPAHATPRTPAPTDLTVQGIDSPVDLDTLTGAQLGWQPPAIDRTTVAPTVVDQSAYQVVVATTAGGAAAGSGDVWDSGKVTSGASQNVAYAGPALSPSSRYWFSVRTWDGTDAVSNWATPSTFGTGPGKSWSDAAPIWSQTPTTAWTNYSVAGSFTITSNAATVLFRGADTADYYLWQFRQASNTLAAEVKVKGAYRVLGTVDLTPLGITLGSTPHAFSIQASGTSFTTRVDGKVVDQRSDPTFSSGWVGLQTGVTETASFSHLTVTAHSGASLYAQSTTSSTSDFSCASASKGVLRIAKARSCIYDPWQNYEVSATYKATSQPTGFTFRDQDTADGYLWQFVPSTSTLKVLQDVRGRFYALTTKKISLRTKVVTGRSYAFRIRVQGTTITTWFAGRQVDSRSHGRYTRGIIGFRNGSQETANFSAISVRSSSGAMVYSNSFSATSIDVPCGLVANGSVTVGKATQCLVRSGAPSDWLFARGQTTLADKPIAWATLYATASSPVPTRQYVYKMYVNGHYVGLGPTQSIGSETRYDGYDVTGDLVSGQSNAIGALLYTTSDHRFLAKLVVHYSDGTEQDFGTSPSWTTLPGLSVYPKAGSIGTQYYTAPVENIDASHYPFGFSTASFDDSGWDPAQNQVAYANLEATPTGKVTQNYRPPTKITQEPNGDYLVDFGRTWAGGVRLTLTNPSTRVVGIEYGEILNSAGTGVQYDTSAGNDYEDNWTYSGGTQTLESWGLRVFRYVVIENSPVPITADDLQASAVYYPFDDGTDADAATFTSSDSTLNAVWQLSRNTMEANTVNLYVDSWTRERGAYEADAYIQQMEHAVLGSDQSLSVYSMDYLLAHPSWPTEWHLYDILAVHDAWMNSGDLTQAQQTYVQLQRILLTPSLDAKTGLIKRDDVDDIIDWPVGERNGYVKSDYDTVVNVLTYRDLVDMADLATALGHTADAATYTSQALALKTAINKLLFDPAKGAYRDGLVTETGAPITHYAIQASAFALAFGVVDPANKTAVANYIQSLGMACSVYCAAFMLPGLYSADAGSVADSFLTSSATNSWVNMIKAGAGSTMEAWDASLKPNTTYSHPWAASPVYDVAQGMFGILPTAPGYSTFQVKPQPGTIQSAAVTQPTVRGSIGAAFHQVAGGHIDVSVQVPSTTTAQVTIPLGAATGATVYVDGVAVQGTQSGSWVTVAGLPSGCHVLTTQPGDAASHDPALTGICTTPYRDGAAS